MILRQIDLIEIETCQTTFQVQLCHITLARLGWVPVHISRPVKHVTFVDLRADTPVHEIKTKIRQRYKDVMMATLFAAKASKMRMEEAEG